MNTFEPSQPSLRNILNDIKGGKIQLPDFQRDWVWDDERIRELLVSVARSFPIGTIMLLRTGGKVKFQHLPLSGQPKSPEPPEKLILDGQQRLTSLAAALGDNAVKTRKKRTNITVHYYIDINEAVNGKIDNAFVSVSADKRKTINSGEKIDLTSPEKEYENAYFPCSKMLHSHQWSPGFNRHSPDKVELFNTFIETVITPFQDYQLPLITLDKETSREAICTIFKKVNTGGVKLGVFDLLTAIYAIKDHNLRNEWKKCEKQLQKWQVLKKIMPDDFLQAVTLLHTYREKRVKGNFSVNAKAETILELSLDAYKELAPIALEGFINAGKFLANQKCLDSKHLPYRTQVVPLAAILSQLGGDFNLKSKHTEHIVRWFWCGVFGEWYNRSVETRASADFEDMLAWEGRGYDQKDLPPTIEKTVFDSKGIDGLKSGQSAVFKGLKTLILHNNPEDFLFKPEVSRLEREDISSLDIHHIFPRKWCKDNGVSSEQCDSIINKTPISSKANRVIGKKAPSVYLKEIEENYGVSSDKMDEILKSHLIDPGALRADDFKRFYELRRQSLLKLIKDAGIEVVTPPPTNLSPSLPGGDVDAGGTD